MAETPDPLSRQSSCDTDEETVASENSSPGSPADVVRREEKRRAVDWGFREG